jgi:hypothetical protein
MKIDWAVVLTVVIVVIILSILGNLLLKKKVDANTGEIKTKFVGFEGDKKDNVDGDEN